MLNYNDYIAAYNDTKNPAAKGRFFTEDVVLETPWDRAEGRDTLVARFSAISRKVREELRPLNVLTKDNKIMAELDAAFMPYEDMKTIMHDFKKGQAVAFRFFAIYECRGDQIAHFRMACWTKPVPVEAF
ncbi:unnamed protein product [Discula destructiva]